MTHLHKIPLFVCILFSTLLLNGWIYFYSKTLKGSATIHGKFQESKTEALDALQMVSSWNAFPNVDIPADAYAKAWQYYEDNYIHRSFKTSFKGTWQNLGPVNCGGRTISIAIDPVDTNVVWLGSASGGLWKSTKGGTGTNAWKYYPTGYPVLGVGSISIDPSNTKIMYIGTGEMYSYGISTNGLIDRTTRGSFGIGILKTTDGGITWHPSLNWIYQQTRGVWKIIINPKKNTTLYAATTEGVYKSADSGHTWKNILPQKMVMDLVMDSRDTGVIYAGVGNLNSLNKGLYQTTNSGASWQVLTNGLPANIYHGRITVSIYPKNPKIVYAHICDVFNTVGLYRSSDQGKTWTKTANQQDIASYQGWYAKGLMLKADDSSKLMVAGIYLFNSINSGDNFGQNTSVHPDFHDIVSNPKDPGKIYVLCDGGLFRSNDFGTTYYDCNNGYVTTQFYIGSVSKTDSTNLQGGIQDNYSQKLIQKNYWKPTLGGDGSYNAINQDDDAIQYASYQYLNVYTSGNGGLNYSGFPAIQSPSDPNGGNPAAFLAPFIICPSNQNIMYAGSNCMIKSTNGFTSPGTNVGPALIDSGNAILAIAASYSSTDSIYCATGPSVTKHMHVFRSIDGGKSYKDISVGLPNRYPRRIIVDRKKSNIVYIVFAGFGTGHIFRSTDAGSHWNDISSTLPNLPFHCLAIDPLNRNIIYAGCDFTIFVSKDTGATWNSFETGLPEAAMIFDLVISPANRSLIAFTHGHGVYTRSLNDVTAHNSGVHMGLPADNLLTVYPNPASGYAYLEFQQPPELNQHFELYNLSGQLVESVFLPAKSTRIKIDIENLPAGIYFLQYRVKDELMTKKILVAGK
jgi:photosystem II stability/assembly factor-like uncharacterized protein